ncbi:MAG: translation initiation factor IF-2 [Acidobacteriota bacterium]|nr:translation initiation factor IF-2 [Acidobacteriota bacterium]
MSEKTRLLKLAPEIKVGVKEIVAYLKQEGMKRVSASSFVGAEVVQDIKDHFSGKKAQKAKAAAPEQPAPAETAEKPQPAPATEAPAKTEEAAEPAAVEPAPADAPPDTAPPTVAEVKPAPPVPEIVPAAPPPASPPPATDPPAVVLQPAAKLEPGSTRPTPATGPVSPPRRPGSAERPSPTETIRQHLSRSGQIRTRPFLSRSRQGAPARPLSLPTGTRPTSGFPPQRRPLTPFPGRPPGPGGPPRDHRRSRPGQRRHGGRHDSREGRFAARQAPTAARPEPFQPIPINRSVTLTEGVTIKELGERLEVKAKDLIKRLLDKGIFATMNQTLDEALAKDLSADFGAEASIVSFEEDAEYEAIAEEKSENIAPRPPVVTIMGHVDHGKTSLLDAIRETDVTSQEAGGITQHIGAYQVEKNQRLITFLDTPGHEAFTMMRARGAKVTDIVVLVVAADDGVMPQTLEAINHARAAKVPIVVAINKIDRPNAQVDTVKKSLAANGLTPEDWGGDTVTVEVSATEKTNLDLLLEMILLVADLQTLKANPQRTAMGTIVEAKLDRGRGPVATVLVQNGTLKVGDSFIAGPVTGKVRAMLDFHGKPVQAAVPAMPVEVLGLESVPHAGDLFQVLSDASRTRQIGNLRQSKLRESQLAKTARLTLEHLHEQMSEGVVKELPIILKADVQGSVEVVSETLSKLSNDKVKVKIIDRGTGAVTETNVLLASASNAVIVGFNVRPEKKAAELASQEGVDIRLHTVIYKISEEIRNAMLGLLDHTFKEIWQGTAQVRMTFKVPRAGVVAGCYISDGKVSRNSKARLLRDNVVIYEGKIASLRRFKDDAGEVRSGLECGIGLERFSDIKNDDVIEAFTMEKVAPQMD